MAWDDATGRVSSFTVKFAQYEAGRLSGANLELYATGVNIHTSTRDDATYNTLSKSVMAPTRFTSSVEANDTWIVGAA